LWGFVWYLIFVKQLDEKEKELKKKLDLDLERKDRTIEEMTREADIYLLFSYR
jgi:bis(5'-adenosyl)-triphosphatase